MGLAECFVQGRGGAAEGEGDGEGGRGSRAKSAADEEKMTTNERMGPPPLPVLWRGDTSPGTRWDGEEGEGGEGGKGREEEGESVLLAPARTLAFSSVFRLEV